MDEHDLQRFVEAQARNYAQALLELKAGQKRSHWMWYVFPQLEGLGRSAVAQRFAIEDVEEAKAYLAHPILGVRLLECTRAVLAVGGREAREIFGFPDVLKFRSSMTLFERAAPDQSDFASALEKYYGGERDPQTLELLD